MWFRFLGWEDPLEEGMEIHSSILAWRMPWTEEPGSPSSPQGWTESDMTAAPQHDLLRACTPLLSTEPSGLHKKETVPSPPVSPHLWLQVEGLLCSEPLSRLEKSPVGCTQQALSHCPLQGTKQGLDDMENLFLGPGCLREEDPEPTLHHLAESCLLSPLFYACCLQHCSALGHTLPPAPLHTRHPLSPDSQFSRSLQPLPSAVSSVLLTVTTPLIHPGSYRRTGADPPRSLGQMGRMRNPQAIRKAASCFHYCPSLLVDTQQPPTTSSKPRKQLVSVSFFCSFHPPAQSPRCQETLYLDRS